MTNVRSYQKIKFNNNEIFNNDRLGINLDTTFPIKIKDCRISNSKCGIWYINKLSQQENFMGGFNDNINNIVHFKTITGSVQIKNTEFID